MEIPKMLYWGSLLDVFGLGKVNIPQNKILNL